MSALQLSRRPAQMCRHALRRPEAPAGGLFLELAELIAPQERIALINAS